MGLRAAAVLLMLAGPTLLVPGDAAAQRPVCEIIRVPGSATQTSNLGTAREQTVITGGAHILCDGTRRVRADRAMVISASNRIELIGNVSVQDLERTLTADEATFYSQTRQLAARSNVVIRETGSGSSIRGDIVDYYQESETRPEARIEAVGTSGPAQAVLIRVADSGAPADSTVIDASQITIVGEQSFTAIGNAVMTRDSMVATGETIRYAQETGELSVARDAVVEMPARVVRGDSINAVLGEDEQLSDVLVRHDASIESEDMSVRAPAIRLELDGDEVSRLVAMPWPAAVGATQQSRPRVDAEGFMMESDSIDVRLPGGQISEAWAIGDAYGERQTPDSMQALLPEVAPDLEKLISSDWMRGDTVRAVFGANPAAGPTDTALDAVPAGAVAADTAVDPNVVDPVAADPDVAQRVLESLMAAGSPAVSVYRMRNEDAPEEKLSINYLTASRIEVSFVGGVVSVVAAQGDARGMYLQPAVPVAGTAGEGTAGAGTTGGGASGGPGGGGS